MIATQSVFSFCTPFLNHLLTVWSLGNSISSSCFSAALLRRFDLLHHHLLVFFWSQSRLRCLGLLVSSKYVYHSLSSQSSYNSPLFADFLSFNSPGLVVPISLSLLLLSNNHSVLRIPFFIQKLASSVVLVFTLISIFLNRGFQIYPTQKIYP